MTWLALGFARRVVCRRVPAAAIIVGLLVVVAQARGAGQEVNRPVGQPVHQPVVQPADKPVDKPVDRPAAHTVPVPADTPTVTPPPATDGTAVPAPDPSAGQDPSASQVGGDPSSASRVGGDPSSAPVDPSTAPQPATPTAPAQSTAPASTDVSRQPPRLMQGDVPVVEEILPSGVRVVIARDDTLPVAAVVLAIATGTRDDPEDYPGLVQAMAYHLLAGNYELRPGAALAAVHDFGGWAGMGISSAHVRFESLVPVSQLERVLWVESQRLRAPTVNRNLWLKSLAYARKERGAGPVVAREAWAEAWRDKGLAHDGHALSATRLEKLRTMVDRQISAQLARLFTYNRTTLVVVAPGDPQRVAAVVRPLFADLPTGQHRRATPVPVSVSATANGPREVAVRNGNGEVFVWPVASTPGAEIWARVFCDAVNRQRRARTDAKKLHVHCAVNSDDFRRIVVVRVRGVEDPPAALAQRLSRLDAGRNRRNLDRRRAKRLRQLQYDLRLPLDLAIAIAGVDPAWEAALAPKAADGPTATVPLSALTGESSLSSLGSWTSRVSAEFALTHAVRLVAPPQGAKP